jgi:hypothetical protein
MTGRGWMEILIGVLLLIAAVSGTLAILEGNRVADRKDEQ